MRGPVLRVQRVPPMSLPPEKVGFERCLLLSSKTCLLLSSKTSLLLSSRSWQQIQ